MAANGTRTIQVKFDGSAKGLVAAAGEVAAVLGRTGKQTGLTKAQADAEALSAKLKQTAKDARESGSLMGGALALGLSAAAPVVAGALVSGVALGFVGMAVLVQKNNKQVVASFAALKYQVVSEMQGTTNQVVPYLAASGHALQQEFANLGPQLHTAFSFAGPDIKILTTGVDNLADNAMPGLVTSMRNSKPIVQGVAVVLGDLGTVATTVLTDVANHGQEFERDLDQIGTLTKNVGSIAGSVLPGLASGFGTTVGTANALLGVLKPVAPFLGDIAGEALPAVGAFKLFGLATKPLNSLGSKVADVASNLGGFTTRLTGSDTAGSKVTKTTSKLGGALGSLGSALPVAGIGFALLGDAMSAAENQQQSVLQGLVAGGQEAKTATDNIAAAAPTIAHLADGFKQGESSAAQFSNALMVATKGMDPLSRATAIYNADLDQFGPRAKQTVTAQRNLAAATDASQVAQQRLSFATQDVNAKLATQMSNMLGLVDADLGFQSSQLAVTQAQNDYVSSLKKTGANSLATKQASISYQQTLTAEVESAGAAAKAHNANATASQQNKAATQAETATILALAGAAGTNAPPALRKMVSGLSAAEISAFAATDKIKGTHQEIVTLPNGKKIKINVDSNGQAVANNTQRALNNLHAPDLRIIAQDGVTSKVNEIIRFNSGKTIHVNVQTGQISALHLPGRASGGPVMAGHAYVVGEHHAEVFVPDVSGRIDPKDPGTTSGGDTFDLVIADQVIASIVDGRLRAHNRKLVARVKAGSQIR